MFGFETHTIAAVDFIDGKVARWVDDWDGRHDGLIALKSPSNEFPKTFGESNITTTPNPVIKNVTSQINFRLATALQLRRCLLSTPSLKIVRRGLE